MAKRGNAACWAIAGACLGAAALLLAFTPTGEWDAWWHLATGRLALETGTALPADPFSYSFAGAPWGHKDLVADVVLYLGFSALGHAAFGALKALAVVALALSAIMVAPGGKRHPALAVLVGGAAVAAIQYRLTERPLLFSLALLPVAIVLLERMRRGLSTERPRALALAAPIAFLLWAWALLHREALLGAAFCGAYLASLWLARLLPGPGRLRALAGPRPPLAPLAVATAVVACGVGLCAATPSGLALFASSAAVARSDALRRIVTDWAPIGPRELLLDFPLTAALVAAAGIAWAARIARALREREADPPVTALHGAVLLALLALSLLDSVRWVPALSTFAALALAVLAADALPGPAPVARLASPRARLAATALLGLLALALVEGRNGFGHGLGEMPDRFPAGAVRFAKERGLGPRAFNSFALGGYAIWAGRPELRVLVDGRNDLVYPPEFLGRAVRAQADPAAFAALLAERGGDWVLAGNLPGHERFAFLARDPAWMMAYWSEAAIVYARRADHPELAGLAYRFIDPRAVDVSVFEGVRRHGGDEDEMAELEREVRRMRDASPTGLRANAAVALYYHLRGPEFRPQRDAALRVLREEHGDERAVVELLGRIGK